MLFDAVLLGIVEGITEFLPISSTGHLIIVNRFIEFQGEFANLFDVVIQLGAILSVIVYFWNRLVPFGNSKTPEQQKEAWSLWGKAIVGVIPALVLGALFGSKIKEHLFNIDVVAVALLVGGIILIIVERMKKESRVDSVAALSYGTAFAIGVIQCLSMVPGTSRSAATIIGAMFLGASRAVAVEYSFFLAIPTMVAASAYSLLKSGTDLTRYEWGVLGVGFATSFVVALGVVAFLINYVRKNDFKPFGYYRIVLGLLLLVFFRHLM